MADTNRGNAAAAAGRDDFKLDGRGYSAAFAGVACVTDGGSPEPIIVWRGKVDIESEALKRTFMLDFETAGLPAKLMDHTTLNEMLFLFRRKGKLYWCPSIAEPKLLAAYILRRIVFAHLAVRESKVLITPLDLDGEDAILNIQMITGELHPVVPRGS